MTWWSWMILGAVFLGAELFAIDVQFYLVFLGLSAGLVGLGMLLGIAIPEWGQWLAFSIIALVSFVTFRKSLYMKIRGGAKGFRESLSGNSVKVTSNLSPGSDARIEYRGSNWTVINVGVNEIAEGSQAKIVKVDGLTLHVSAD